MVKDKKYMKIDIENLKYDDFEQKPYFSGLSIYDARAFSQTEPSRMTSGSVLLAEVLSTTFALLCRL